MILRSCAPRRNGSAQARIMSGSTAEGEIRHHREAVDAHDGDGTRYIVLLDAGYPVATCRFYELDAGRVILGRVVVLPEYRGKELGRRAVCEAEAWIRSLGYRAVEIESRVTAVGFYQKLGFQITDSTVVKSGVFDCVRMEKQLTDESAKAAPAV